MKRVTALVALVATRIVVACRGALAEGEWVGVDMLSTHGAAPRSNQPQSGHVPSTKRSARNCSQLMQNHCCSSCTRKEARRHHQRKSEPRHALRVSLARRSVAAWACRGNHLLNDVVVFVAFPEDVLRHGRLLVRRRTAEMVKGNVEPLVDVAVDGCEGEQQTMAGQVDAAAVGVRR